MRFLPFLKCCALLTFLDNEMWWLIYVTSLQILATKMTDLFYESVTIRETKKVLCIWNFLITHLTVAEQAIRFAFFSIQRPLLDQLFTNVPEASFVSTDIKGLIGFLSMVKDASLPRANSEDYNALLAKIDLKVSYCINIKRNLLILTYYLAWVEECAQGNWPRLSWWERATGHYPIRLASRIYCDVEIHNGEESAPKGCYELVQSNPN